MIWDEINRKSFYKYYRLVDPGSIQGSHRPVVSREEMYLTITSWNIATQLAKMNIDRLGEFTADVFHSLLLILQVLCVVGVFRGSIHGILLYSEYFGYELEVGIIS